MTVFVVVASTVGAVSFAAEKYGCFVESVGAEALVESTTAVEAGVSEIPWITVMSTATVLSEAGVESDVAAITSAVEISEIDSVTGIVVVSEANVISVFVEVSKGVVMCGSAVVYDGDAVFWAVLVSETDVVVCGIAEVSETIVVFLVSLVSTVVVIAEVVVVSENSALLRGKVAGTIPATSDESAVVSGMEEMLTTASVFEIGAVFETVVEAIDPGTAVTGVIADVVTEVSMV